ncbi:MAG: DpnD/PcfM family protein [Bacteroidia bacterium]|nr:DpnD/PcfM family protein [Bacteroidia bacterium]
MQTYKIEIKEILALVVEIKAKSVDEALEIVKQKYKNEEIILSADQCVAVEINESESN